MSEPFSNINSFWSQVVQPGESQEVLFPDNAYLTITNVSISDNGSTNNDPVRLLLHVISKNQNTSSDVLIATLIPGAFEHQGINIVLSPINVATFEVKGKMTVHVAGHFSLVDETV